MSTSASATAASADVTTIAIDLAKDVFQVAHASAGGQVIHQQRLKSRKAFALAMVQWVGKTVVMEACATANDWGRRLQALGFAVVLLPAQLVRPYRPRNKTDAADTLALLEAFRNQRIKPVPVKSLNQQVMLTLHSLREQHKTTRVARINALRGLCKEFGCVLPLATQEALAAAPAGIETLPVALHAPLQALLEEIEALAEHMLALERQIEALNRQTPAALLLQTIPGIGRLTSSALVASAGGPEHFANGRQLSAWLGITPREHSSGNQRWLGSISKQGDGYVRTLVIHGARSALQVALALRQKAPEQLTRLQAWAVRLYDRSDYNRSTVALANKMIRLCWTLWHTGECYRAEGAHPQTATATMGSGKNGQPQR